MSDSEQRHEDLTALHIVAKRSLDFLTKVLAPLIGLGIAAVISGCWQVHDMGRDFRGMQNSLTETNAKMEAMNEKVLRMFYAGGWDKRTSSPTERNSHPDQ